MSSQMSFRALAALGLLILALAAERCGYYAARSVLVIDLTQHGLARTSTMSIFRAFTFVVYGSAFAGGGLAFAFGPRVTAAVGAAIAAVGAFALAAGAPPSLTCFVLALGAGIFKGCPYAAAAEILADEDGGASQGFLPTPRRFASFATFAVLTYGSINLGAFIAPLVAGVFRSTRDSGGFTTTYAFAGAVDVLAAILAGIAIFLGSGAAKTMAQQAHAPYRGPDGVAAGAPTASAPTNDVFVPLTLLGVVFAAMHFVMNHGQPNPITLGLLNTSWVHSLNPIVVLLMTVPCAALFFVLALQRSAVPLTRILGAGIAVFALGGMLAALAMFLRAGLAVWTPALAISAIGEAIAFPIGLTYAALVLRSRAATMVVAGWMTLTAMPDFLFGMTFTGDRYPFVETLLVTVSALVVLVGAVLVLVNAARLHRDLGGHSNATS
jgi:dipeptide/tripeptide permease